MLKPLSAHLDRAHKYRVARFQDQLKLESVTFFPVSHFLLCTVTCVGAAHKDAQDQASPDVRMALKMSHIPQNEWQIQVLASWLFL